jgi:hypothetical protein
MLGWTPAPAAVITHSRRRPPPGACRSCPARRPWRRKRTRPRPPQPPRWNPLPPPPPPRSCRSKCRAHSTASPRYGGVTPALSRGHARLTAATLWQDDPAYAKLYKAHDFDVLVDLNAKPLGARLAAGWHALLGAERGGAAKRRALRPVYQNMAPESTFSLREYEQRFEETYGA